ncbi:MAG: COG4705 family protein [Solirubrobacterales bacterium]
MDQTTARSRRARHAFSKVPEVTAYFWIVKALTTAMGESTSDFLVHTLVPEVAVVLGGIAFVIALYLQFAKDRYVPWAYWLAVAMVGVFGTMAADVLHVGLGVPYVASTIFYAIVLTAVFRTWYVSEGTLSIHSITSPRRELFYWAAVLATFALGTAAGDLTAVTLGIGYFGSILLFAAVIAVPAIGYFRLGWNPILSFWFAYVVTRPLGASVADWLAVSHARGGLALGTGPVSLVFAAAIAAFVYHLARTGRDTPSDQLPEPQPPAERRRPLASFPMPPEAPEEA